MQDGEYIKYNTALRTVGIIALLGILVWVVLMLRGNHTDKQEPVPVDATLPSNEQIYTNDQYGFTIRYDDRFGTPSEEEKLNSGWRFNTQTKGDLLMLIRLPKEFMPNTNFSEAIITVGASKDMTECLVASNGEYETTTTASVRIPDFKVFSLGDAGAGNFYEVQSYRTIKNGTCIALERMVHSTSIDNYPVEMGITEFDRRALDEVLDRVIESFHFN